MNSCSSGSRVRSGVQVVGGEVIAKACMRVSSGEGGGDGIC